MRLKIYLGPEPRTHWVYTRTFVISTHYLRVFDYSFKSELVAVVKGEGLAPETNQKVPTLFTLFKFEIVNIIRLALAAYFCRVVQAECRW